MEERDDLHLGVSYCRPLLLPTLCASRGVLLRELDSNGQYLRNAPETRRVDRNELERGGNKPLCVDGVANQELHSRDMQRLKIFASYALPRICEKGRIFRTRVTGLLFLPQPRA